MNNKPVTKVKTRARLEILNYISNSCLANMMSSGPGNFEHQIRVGRMRGPNPGDLVSLRSVRSVNEWYLSWYEKRILKKDGDWDDEHILESIETNELCQWGNVSFLILNRSVVNQNPQWRWTDKQFEFSDRWYRAFNKCSKQRKLWDMVPIQPFFGDNESVSLSARIKFTDTIWEKKFDNWKKTKIKDMTEFINDVSEGL